MHLAIGTSLVVMVVTALYTALLRHRRGDLDWALFWRIAPRVVIGAVLGAICGDLLPGLTFACSSSDSSAHHRPSVASPIRRRGELHGLREDPGAPTVPGGASLWIYGLATGICGALLGAEQPSLSCRTFAPRDTGSSSHRPSRRVFPRLSAWVQALVTWPVD